MSQTKRIILAGGSGFLGALLAKRFFEHGFEVIILTRDPGKVPVPGVRMEFWDGKTAGKWATLLDGAEAVINLAGRSVNCRYTKKNREAIMDSRVLSTEAIGKAIRQSAVPPRLWMNSSTGTIYKHSLNRPMDEAGEIDATPEAKDGFSVEVAQAWENAFNTATTPATRKVALRIAMVFGTREGGVYRVLRRLARFGLGGRMGSGDQYVSWIHEEDFCRTVEWLVDHDDISGPVNICAPCPLPNREMMRALRRVVGAPFGLPATRWMLEVGAFFLRTETELIIKSRRVIPGRLLANGFQFKYPEFEPAVREIETRCR